MLISIQNHKWNLVLLLVAPLTARCVVEYNLNDHIIQMCMLHFNLVNSVNALQFFSDSWIMKRLEPFNSILCDKILVEDLCCC